MANLVPVSSFDDVYQIETTDVVLGGPGEVANSQAQALTNRTTYLKERVDRSQKVYFSDFSSVSLTYSGNPAVKVFTFTPGSGLDNRPLISKLRFKVAIFDNYVSTSKVFDFEFILNESNSPSIEPNSRLILQKYYGLSKFDQSFYFIMKKVIPEIGHAYYEFYIEKNTSNNHYYHFIQVACLDEMDSYKGFLGTGDSESIINHVVFETGSLTAISPLKNVNSDENYITSIIFNPVIHTDPYAVIVSQPMASHKTPSSWNNDYIIGGNSQKILYSGPKNVSLTTTNTAVKLFSYKYKLTATPLSAQRLDKSVKFDVHYGCTSDIFYSSLRQYELVFASEYFYLKLLKQSSDFGNSPSVADNSPVDIYLIVRQRDDVDGYTYFDFYLDDTKITETRTKNIEVIVYDDVKEALRDKIIFNTTLSAIAKMYNVSSSTNIQTSIHSVLDTDVTNIIVSGGGITAHTPSSATPISIIGETRIKTAETDIDNLQNLVFSQWEYVVPGDHTWTCPWGVTKIKLFVVGGGGAGGYYNGGGGGGVAIHNNYSVTPGTTYNLRVGRGGVALTPSDGSWFKNTSSIRAEGGETPPNITTRAMGGNAIGGELNLTGGKGGLHEATDLLNDLSGATGGGSKTEVTISIPGGSGTHGGGGGGAGSGSSDTRGEPGGRGGIYGGNGGNGSGGINVSHPSTPGGSGVFGGFGGVRGFGGGGGGAPGGGGGGSSGDSSGGGADGCVIIRVGGSNF